MFTQNGARSGAILTPSLACGVGFGTNDLFGYEPNELPGCSTTPRYVVIIAQFRKKYKGFLGFCGDFGWFWRAYRGHFWVFPAVAVGVFGQEESFISGNNSGSVGISEGGGSEGRKMKKREEA